MWWGVWGDDGAFERFIRLRHAFFTSCFHLHFNARTTYTCHGPPPFAPHYFSLTTTTCTDHDHSSRTTSTCHDSRPTCTDHHRLPRTIATCHRPVPPVTDHHHLSLTTTLSHGPRAPGIDHDHHSQTHHWSCTKEESFRVQLEQPILA